MGEDGKGLQAAVPSSIMKKLQENYGLTTECFASPFNVTCENFCSAFYDLEQYFGSKGSFLQATFSEGVYEVNPPFDESIMLKSVNHIFHLLEKSRDKPLAFIVIVPNWNCASNQLMTKSAFKVLETKLPAGLHDYEIGVELKRSVCDTRIVILANGPWRLANKKILSGDHGSALKNVFMPM